MVSIDDRKSAPCELWHLPKSAPYRLWIHLLTYLLTWTFQRTDYWTPEIQDGWDPPSWKSTWRLFSAEGGPIWIKFQRLVQNDMSTAVIWSKSKPDVKFQYGERFGEFHGMSSQSHLPHCRVLPPGEFSVMIPELHVTLQGAATGRIQRHVISEPRRPITLHCAATWWIHSHDSRATCHIAGCSHLVKSMSWLCHNHNRHIEIVFRHILFYFVF